jgi:histone acetyltransferase (RNA polymerase elongator complex component)
MSKKQVTIPIFVPHLGCPHRCVFCNQWQSSGEKKIPDGEFIKEKIELYLSTIPDSVERIEVAFFGGSFSGIEPEKQEEFLKAAYRFKKAGFIQAIRLSTRPDYIDEEKLRLLKSYEAETVELGVQSFSDRVLAASQRGHTVSDTYKAIDLLKSNGFNLVIQLMPGLPGETTESSIRSAEIAASLKPDSVRIYPTVVLDKTRLAEMYHTGQYRALSMEEAVEICKEMLLIFSEQGIPVIRIGLHPFSEDAKESIIDGPYHPAFGFLVKSRIKREVMENKIAEALGASHFNPKKKLKLFIPELEREEYIGYKRENLKYLRNKYNRINMKFILRGRYTDTFKII